MLEPGASIENPLTGERFTFLRTGRQTGGALAQIQLDLAPTAFLAAEHIHRVQEERFEIIEGKVRLRRHGDEVVCTPGESVVVPAGTPHAWAPVDGGATVLITFTPGNEIEDFFEDFCRLATEGRTNKRGIPRPFDAARMCMEHDMYLASPPIPMQRAVFRMLNATAKAIGRR